MKSYTDFGYDHNTLKVPEMRSLLTDLHVAFMPDASKSTLLRQLEKHTACTREEHGINPKEYLQPGFQPNRYTKAMMRQVLSQYDIPYGSNPERDELFVTFMDHLPALRELNGMEPDGQPKEEDPRMNAMLRGMAISGPSSDKVERQIRNKRVSTSTTPAPAHEKSASAAGNTGWFGGLTRKSTVTPSMPSTTTSRHRVVTRSAKSKSPSPVRDRDTYDHAAEHVERAGQLAATQIRDGNLAEARKIIEAAINYVDTICTDEN